jgi:hypothetical protein
LKILALTGFLVGNGQPIAKNALTILINISHDAEVLDNLAADDAFLETLLKKITVCRLEPGPDSILAAHFHGQRSKANPSSRTQKKNLLTKSPCSSPISPNPNA